MSEPNAQLTLSVNDRVVYPNQGVCRVTAIEVKEVAGQKLQFVTMRREEDGAVVMVPEAKVKSIGIRRVADRTEVDKIFAFLRSDSDKADLDWKQRARTNLDRMTQGGVLGLAEVVKGLQVLSELRPLPTKERELYDNARHLLVSEVSAGLGVSEVDAEDAIDIVLFPPGKERPKRTVAEFQAGDEEGLDDLDPDLLNLGSDLDLPSDEEASDPEATEVAGKPARGGEPEETTADGVDDEVTQPAGSALIAEPVKRKRGRPPKPKPPVDPNAPPPAPKKRGRPPKPKPPVDPNAPPPAPKKRGRPPKNKDGAKK